MPGDELAHVPTSAEVGDHLHEPLETRTSSPPPPVQLGPVDRLPLEAFARGDLRDLLQHVTGLATALATGDRDGSRIRLIAKGLSTERATQALLTALIGERLSAGDMKGAAVADKLLNSCVERQTKLLQAHREETRGAQRNVMLVAHADQICVGTREE